MSGQSGVPFTLVTDAFLEQGYGGVLLQYQNGRNRVIAYFSRVLKAHEKNCSAYVSARIRRRSRRNRTLSRLPLWHLFCADV